VCGDINTTNIGRLDISWMRMICYKKSEEIEAGLPGLRKMNLIIIFG